MKFPKAPYTLKMACGENPKRVYGNREQEPSTRMANVAGYRTAWIDAEYYLKEIERYAKKWRIIYRLTKLILIRMRMKKSPLNVI
jgi:hypothetical protein